MYACGDSGGACLLVYGAALQKNRVLAAAAGVKPSGLPVLALGLLSGMFYTNRFDKIDCFCPDIFMERDTEKVRMPLYFP